MANTELQGQELDQNSSSILEEVFYDVQKHLHIVGKSEKPTLPKFIAINKLPSIELFKDSLDEELAAPDLTQEDRDRIAAEEAQKLKEEEEIQKAEEEARLKAEEEARQKEEQERLETEQKAKEEAERLEAERLQQEEEERQRAAAEEEARLKAEEEERQKAEQERLEAEAREKEEQERLQKEQEEAEARAAALQRQSMSVISFETLKGKKKPIAKKSIMQDGGISAAIMAQAQQKEELDAIKKEDAREKAAIRREEQQKVEEERLKNAILIGNTKKASPELGKFEIAKSDDPLKPYKFVLKTEQGKVVYETAPLRTKPNELTAVMFKDIMANGSFSFIKTLQGYNFRILDARQRIFCTSRAFRTSLDAQKAAALVKKYGLSANYIDDTTI